jgi:hypothetical protein
VETTARRVRNLPDWVVACAVFVVFCGVFMPSITTDGVQANDTRAAAVAAYLYVETGSLRFPDTWPADHAFWAVERPDGAVSVNRMPGVILTGVPFYAAARLFGVTPRLADVPHPVFVPYGPAGVAAAVTTAAALALLFLLLLQVVSRRDALIATAVLGLTTPLWSVAADALWPHATTALMLAVLMHPKIFPVLSGAASGMLVLTRPHLMVVPLVFGWAKLSLRTVCVAAGGVAGLFVLVFYSQLLFGTWLPASGYDTSGFLGRLATATPWATLENIGQAWFNIDRGVALHTPWVLLLLPLVWFVWRDAPAFAKRGFIAGVLYFVLQMRMARASGGSGFAQWRTSLETLVLWAPLLTFAASQMLRRHRSLLWLFLLTVAVAFVMTVRGVIDGGHSEWAYEWWAEQQKEHAPG